MSSLTLPSTYPHASPESCVPTMKGIAVRRPYGTSGTRTVYPAVALKKFPRNNEGVQPLGAGGFWVLLGVQKYPQGPGPRRPRGPDPATYPPAARRAAKSQSPQPIMCHV